MIYKCQIFSTKPLTAWVILKWSLFTRCWTLIYKQLVFEIFICGIFRRYMFSAFCQIFLNESPTNIVRAWIKAIEKSLLPCQNFCLWVLMKKGKDEIICVERLTSITFEKTLTKNVEKKSFLLEKTFNVWNVKTFAS